MGDGTVYKKSVAEAREKGELDLFRDSNRLNGECAAAIDREISACRYNGNYYDAATAAKNAIAEYGAERVAWVLAGVLKSQHYDGRYSTSNKKWAQDFPIPAEGTRAYLQSHPVLVDYFTDKAREQIAELDKDTPEKLAHDYHDFLKDFDPYGYRDAIATDDVERAIADDARSIANSGKDFEDIQAFLAGIVKDYSDDNDPSTDEYARKAQSLIDRLNTYAEQKPSILARLQEGKQAAAKGEDVPKTAPKRDNERGV